LAATIAASTCSSSRLAYGTARAGETFPSATPHPLEVLVLGFPRDVEFAAEEGHALAVVDPNEEAHSFVQRRLSPVWSKVLGAGVFGAGTFFVGVGVNDTNQN
jgi:hypothetical protein